MFSFPQRKHGVAVGGTEDSLGVRLGCQVVGAGEAGVWASVDPQGEKQEQ